MLFTGEQLNRDWSRTVISSFNLGGRVIATWRPLIDVGVFMIQVNTFYSILCKQYPAIENNASDKLMLKDGKWKNIIFEREKISAFFF